MIKYPGDHIGLPVAGSAEKGIVDDEYIFAVFTGQRPHEIVDNGSRQKCGKPEPVRLYAIEKAIVSVLTEVFTEGVRPDLHVHTAGIEDIPDHISEYLHDGNSFFLAGITFSQ